MPRRAETSPPPGPRRRRARAARACALIAALALAPASLSQAQATGAAWPEDVRRAPPAEYAAAGAMAVATLMLALNRPDEPRTSGMWLLDGNVRGALRLDSFDARNTVDTISDFGLWTVVSYPFVDAFLAATVLKADPRVPVEMAVQSALVLSGAGMLTYLTKDLVARDRPYSAQCRADAGYAPECLDAEAPASFVSGHATLTFAAATMSCVHHFELEPYQSRGADAAGCVVPLALATAISVMRIMADQHYATDVLAGAALGTLSGLGLGLLLHY